ncbi:MAG: adaptor protein MecA [Lachnospirales bacterium]
MVMELISESTIKIILGSEDLRERDMKLAELVLGGNKAQELFQEIAMQAQAEFEFEIDNRPIMVEAMPHSSDSVTIIITKVENEEDLNKFYLSRTNASDVAYNRFEETYTKGSDELLAGLNGVRSELSKGKVKNSKNMNLIFSFKDINSVAAASNNIEKNLFSSSVYKDDKRYFLLLEMKENKKDSAKLKDTELKLLDYGVKHSNDDNSLLYMKEYGKIIIKNDAIKVLNNWK